MTINAEATVPYRTFLTTALVTAARGVFNQHKDRLLKNTNITIDFPKTENHYPAIIVRFYGRDITPAGVGHVEYITTSGSEKRFLHAKYTGDVEFAIEALTSLDRDIISDTLVQMITMGSLNDFTNYFINHTIHLTADDNPDAAWNYLAINAGRILEFGQTQKPVPWQSEDDLIFRTSYRVGCMGEFYNLPTAAQVAATVEHVNLFPYVLDREPIPDGTVDPSIWLPPLD